MENERILHSAYKFQAILVALIAERYKMGNEDDDTAIIRSEIDEAIKDIACAAKSLTERGLFREKAEGEADEDGKC